ncbi:hypothetical protein STEG23_009947, partial [Scotinomys teguina]
EWKPQGVKHTSLFLTGADRRKAELLRKLTKEQTDWLRRWTLPCLLVPEGFDCDSVILSKEGN